jgi:hypothetical protein
MSMPTASAIHLETPSCCRRQGEEWGGKSLLELQQPHKSRLVREQEAWAKEVRRVLDTFLTWQTPCAAFVVPTQLAHAGCLVVAAALPVSSEVLCE